MGNICCICQPEDLCVSVHRCGSGQPCFVVLRVIQDHLLGCDREGFETFLCTGRCRASRCRLYGQRVRQVRPNVGPNCINSAKCGSLGRRARLGGRSTSSRLNVTFVDTARPQVRSLADCDISFPLLWRALEALYVGPRRNLVDSSSVQVAHGVALYQHGQFNCYLVPTFNHSSFAAIVIFCLNSDVWRSVCQSSFPHRHPIIYSSKGTHLRFNGIYE